MALFKEQGFELPMSYPVLIAVSGGLDSMTLAHLISRYGRKIIAPELITLLHLDHGWRAESGTTEKEGVALLAEKLGVKILHRKLEVCASSQRSENREEDARIKRTEVYESLAGEECTYRFVLTAHHQDDLAETLFWRLARGELIENRAGILFKDFCVLRPLLKVSKELLRSYASEESISFFEDPTNQDTQSFRAWYRKKLLPELQNQFPRFNQTLARYAEDEGRIEASPLAEVIQTVTSSRVNRAQRKALQELTASAKVGGRLTLAGGIVLTRVKTGFLIENLNGPKKI